MNTENRTLSLIRSEQRDAVGNHSNTYNHQIILKGYIKNGKNIKLTLTSGDCVEGRVTQFDEDTITVMPIGESSPHTFFKHSIESFCSTAQHLQ